MMKAFLLKFCTIFWSNEEDGQVIHICELSIRFYNRIKVLQPAYMFLK